MMSKTTQEQCENEVRRGRRGQWERCMNQAKHVVSDGNTSVQVCTRCMKEMTARHGSHRWEVVT